MSSIVTQGAYTFIKANVEDCISRVCSRCGSRQKVGDCACSVFSVRQQKFQSPHPQSDFLAVEHAIQVHPISAGQACNRCAKGDSLDMGLEFFLHVYL
jgi:hypothetical protein